MPLPSFAHLPIVGPTQEEVLARVATHCCRKRPESSINPRTCELRRSPENSKISHYIKFECSSCEGPVPKKEPIVSNNVKTYKCTKCEKTTPSAFFPSCTTRCKECLTEQKRLRRNTPSELTGKKQTCRECGEEFDEYKHGPLFPRVCQSCLRKSISAGLIESNRAKAGRIVLTFDFPRDQELWDFITEQAHKDRRNPDNQIMFMLEERAISKRAGS